MKPESSIFPDSIHGRNLVVVGIGDLGVSAEADDMLVTYSLGSCVGVAIYDRVRKSGGLLHAMLPLSREARGDRENPLVYMDRGLETLLSRIFGQGSRRKDLVAWVAGGSTMFEDRSHFRIGERNFAIARKILWKNNILISGEDTGGNVSRTIYLEIESGKCYLRAAGALSEL